MISVNLHATKLLYRNVTYLYTNNEAAENISLKASHLKFASKLKYPGLSSPKW